MANFFLDYSNAETEYSDGDIENDLLEIVKSAKNLDEIVNQDTRWPVIYHLSRLRQNILNWYPFDDKSEILEVGAGCGAITGLLCEKCKHVTAVELTKQRALINYERNKSYSNLDIYVGDIFKINFEKKFDYITLIGVLEYAAYMCSEQDPYQHLLAKLKDFLNPGGHILIAIENRFGLKYFAGAKEDHTGKYFDGINGYDSDSKVKTFTKSEMKGLITRSGFVEHKFYYTLPDYKFPKVILTDDTINTIYPKVDLHAVDGQRLELFNEAVVMQNFVQEGILDHFSNSFLIDIGKPTDISFAVLNAGRKAEFAQISFIKTINGKSHFFKAPLSPLAEHHIKRMADIYENRGQLNGMKLAKSECFSGLVEMEYISYPTLWGVLKESLDLNNEVLFFKLLDRFHFQLFEQSFQPVNAFGADFKSVFGTTQYNGKLTYSCPSNVDLSFDNIFLVNNEFIMTDYEWTFNFPVPAEFVFWRAVYSCSFIQNKKSLFNKIMSRFSITNEMQVVFYSWERHFSSIYIGYDEISCKAIEPIGLDLNSILKSGLIKDVSNTNISSIYLDNGQGYKENNRIDKAVDLSSDLITLDYDLKNVREVKNIRFDPLEGIECECKIVDVLSNLGSLRLRPNNALSSEDYDFFISRDPNYQLIGDCEKVEWLRISFQINIMDRKMIENHINNYRTKTQQNIQELNREVSRLAEQNAQIISSKSWRFTKPVRYIGKLLTKI